MWLTCCFAWIIYDEKKRTTPNHTRMRKPVTIPCVTIKWLYNDKTGNRYWILGGPIWAAEMSVWPIWVKTGFMLLKLFTWKLISEAKSWRVNQLKVMGWVFVNKSTWYVLVQCPGKTTPMCVHGNCKQDSSEGNSHSSKPSWPVSDNSQHPTIHYKLKTVRSRHNI